IVEDLVGDVLVEDAAVPELDDVVLERFQLDAPSVGHVRDADLAEIGQARLGTERRELGTADRDLVVALGTGIRKRLKFQVSSLESTFKSQGSSPRCQGRADLRLETSLG